MSDLTDEQLEGMDMWDRDVMLDERHRAVWSMLVRMAVAEIRRHRAARRADAARIAEVVREAIGEYARYAEGNPMGGHAAVAEDIATRVAEQLAAPVLSAEEHTSLDQTDRVRLRNIIALLRQQPVCWDMEAALLDRLLGGGQ